MKKIFLSFLIFHFSFLILFSQSGGTTVLSQQNGAVKNSFVSGATTAPANSAILEGRSTTKGFLPPRMNTTQRNAISSPAAGLMIYNTVTRDLNFYNSLAWQGLNTSGWYTLVDTVECDSTYIKIPMLANPGFNSFVLASENGFLTSVRDTTIQNLFWGRSGNTDVDTSNFLGTLVNVPLKFKQNEALAGIVDGAFNTITAFGYQALNAYNTASSAGNSAFGNLSLKSTVDGQNNTAIGDQALRDIANAGDANNTAIGYSAGSTLTTGQDNTFLGYATGIIGNAGNNATAIGANALIGLDNCVSIGDTTTLVGVGIGTAYPQAKLDVRGSFRLVDGTEAANYVLTSDADGDATWQAAPTSGTFTPIETDSVNVTLATVNTDAMYTRVGNIVTVQYSYLVDPAVTLTSTSITVDLPAGIAANPSATPSGQGSFFDDSPASVIVTPVDGTHCIATFVPVATTPKVLNFSVTYETN